MQSVFFTILKIYFILDNLLMTAKYNTLSVRILSTQHVKSFSFIMDILHFIKLNCKENQAHQNHRFVT